MTPDLATRNVMGRSIKRERERTSRLRRAANFDRMRWTCDALQRAVLVMRTLDEPVWERRLGADAIRMRGILRLANEAQTLRVEQTELRRLLQEHQLSAKVIADMLTESTLDNWDWTMMHWRKLASKYFQPWPLDACEEVIETALKAVNAFQWRTDHQSSGMSFFGWRELRYVDHDQQSLEFEFRKTFRGYEIMDYVNTMWGVFTDRETYQNVIVAHHIHTDLDILQQLGPNLVIGRTVEQFPGMTGYVHVVFLLNRIKTETGFIQILHSVCCPDVIRAIGSESDVWPSNFLWCQWKHLEDGTKGYTYRFGGCLRGFDPSYASQWMVEIFGVVLRSERVATRRVFLAYA